MLIEYFDPVKKQFFNVEVDAPIFTGGQGKVFFNDEKNLAIKVYHQNENSSLSSIDYFNRTGYIDRVISLGYMPSFRDKKSFCFPIGRVTKVDNSPSVGVVTRKSSNKILMDFLFPMSNVVKYIGKNSFGYDKYFRTARNIAKLVDTLHRNGCAHSDIHYKNFLIDAVSCDVDVIDLDGVVVNDFLPPAVAGLRGFMAPEVYIHDNKLPDILTDRHSLAVLIYYMLLFFNPLTPLRALADSISLQEKLSWGDKALYVEHPDDHSNRPSNYAFEISPEKNLSKGFYMSSNSLPSGLRRLFHSTFVENLFVPEKRPTAYDYSLALSHAMDELVLCPGCKNYIPYPVDRPRDKRYCPVCGEECITYKVIEMYNPVEKLNYKRTFYRIALNHGYNIYESQVINAFPSEKRSEKEAKIAKVRVSGEKFYITNLTSSSWTYSFNNSKGLLHTGASLELRKDTCIVFNGNDKRPRRMARVIE